ncbi:hypothetical protein J6590_086494 [Homalodisca vitripennis]|nr:hypothetical protein J6590_086494 [Homalodisca vitripennis]
MVAHSLGKLEFRVRVPAEQTDHNRSQYNNRRLPNSTTRLNFKNANNCLRNANKGSHLLSGINNSSRNISLARKFSNNATSYRGNEHNRMNHVSLYLTILCLTTIGASSSHPGPWLVCLSAISIILGYQDTAVGNQHHTLGYQDTALVNQDHILGYQDSALGNQHHILGYQDTALVNQHHILGYQDTALGNQHHILGYQDTALVNQHHILGYQDTALGNQHRIQGYQDTALGNQHHILGYQDFVAPVLYQPLSASGGQGIDQAGKHLVVVGILGEGGITAVEGYLPHPA